MFCFRILSFPIAKYNAIILYICVDSNVYIIIVNYWTLSLPVVCFVVFVLGSVNVCTQVFHVGLWGERTRGLKCYRYRFGYNACVVVELLGVCRVGRVFAQK